MKNGAMILLAVTWAGLVSPKLLASDQVPTSETRVRCGEALQAEFTRSRERHEYPISISAGQALKFQAVPIGDFLKMRADIFEPGGTKIHSTGEEVVSSARGQTGVSSANGIHKIVVENFRSYHQGATGVYRLQVSCLSSDGTEVGGSGGSGGSVSQATGSAVSVLEDVASEFSGTANEGKANKYLEEARNISEAAGQLEGIVTKFRAIGSLLPRRGKKKRLEEERRALAAERRALEEARSLVPGGPLPGGGGGGAAGSASAQPPAAQSQPNLALPKLALGIPISGTLSAAGQEVFGFLFDANQGQTVELKLQRTVGNLALSLVLVGPGEQTLIQMPLPSGSPSCAIPMALPASGEYSLQVRRMSLPIDGAARDTTFQVAALAK